MSFIHRKPKNKIAKSTGNANALLEKLDKYLKDNTDNHVQFLARFWEDQRDTITYQEIREAIVNGYLSPKTIELWMHDYSKLVKDKMTPLWIDAIGAGSTSQPLMDIAVGRAGAEFVLDFTQPAVISWLEEHAAQFITNAVTEQNDAIKALILEYETEKYTVDELSRVIRPCIGLTEPQAKANLRYYNNIKSQLRKDHPKMKAETIKRKARESALKYAEKQHRQRAYTIAQTEMAYAYNRGADEGIRQAQEQNLIGEIKKVWCTSGDENVCSICAALNGLTIDMDEEFDFKGGLFVGQRLTPPAHPRCGCAVEYVEISPP